MINLRSFSNRRIVSRPVTMHCFFTPARRQEANRTHLVEPKIESDPYSGNHRICQLDGMDTMVVRLTPEGGTHLMPKKIDWYYFRNG